MIYNLSGNYQNGMCSLFKDFTGQRWFWNPEIISFIWWALCELRETQTTGKALWGLVDSSDTSGNGTKQKSKASRQANSQCHKAIRYANYQVPYANAQMYVSVIRKISSFLQNPLVPRVFPADTWGWHLPVTKQRIISNWP